MQNKGSSRYAWMAFAAICVMSMMWTGIQYNCMNLYAAPVVDDLGISRTQFMAVLSIPAVISAAISLFFFGHIERRLGIRRMMLVGGTLNTLAFASWMLMDSLPMLYLGGTLYGLGCGITAYTCISAAVNTWFKQRMGTLVGVANSLGSATGIVFSVLIATLIAAVGWRYSFAVSTAASVVALVVCVTLYRGSPDELGVEAMYADDEEGAEADAGGAAPSQDPSHPAWDQTFRQAIRQPRLWWIAFGYLLLGTTTYAVMSTLPLFALDLGYGQMQGQAVSISLIASTAAMVPLGMLCDKAGTKWGLAVTALLVAAAALLFRLPALPWAAVAAGAACSGAAYSACGVTVGVGVKEALGEVDFSKKLGLCSGCMFVGLALAPTLTSLAYDTMGTYELALGAYVVLAAIMAVVFFACMRTPASKR